ncbi:MAG TPA: APC family permease [Candidatus Acidoferrales bacterium]|jgi:amino acid transporter|nr:APC family permease [Candidatus Acidoferrales bacterium]
MPTNPAPQITNTDPKTGLPRVVIATTAMLSFISFWRAAAIVLNDLGSSAFYAGAIAEQAIGKAAPWFILAIMLFAYAVRSMYIESCSMFVRGGVYRVVKEAMGSTLAKFSVSALMFDYILTGPISGVSAGQYLTGFLNELFARFHVSLILPINSTSAVFAIVVTVFFWWENIKGIPESSGKALRIMYVTTVMVVVMIGWCILTVIMRGAHLPPLPSKATMTFAPEALGWLRFSTLPHTVAIIGILIGLGHSVLAMSGEETLAQVYREVEHPKLPNLEKAGLVIFVYSLIFTAGVSFFASMIIPDAVRPQFFGNLISGLALNFVGPYNLKLAFEGFVVIVGVLMLAGAVNTAIVGSNGVLNRVSEDGILPHWFRHPHPRFGTSYRMLNLVVAMQLLTIILSRGNIFVLGEAYAFGVMWSFSMKGLAVLVLRYKQPGKRDFRVPLNFTIGHTEIPVGLGLITLVLFALSVMNLFTKQVATISGVAFTLIFFTIFEISEKITLKHGAKHQDLDQFNLESDGELTPAALGVRAGNELVMIRNSNTLYNLGAVLDRINPRLQDVVVLHLRVLGRAGTGENELEAQDLFSINEQELFTRALSLAEKRGKSIHLAVAPSTAKWDGILRAAQSLQSSTIALGMSSWRAMADEARMAGLAWEALPEPRPNLTLEIYSPDGQEHVFYLGPHAPRLTPKEIDLLHGIWLELSSEVAPEELHHHDVVHVALEELRRSIDNGKRAEIVGSLRQHLIEIRDRRGTTP